LKAEDARQKEIRGTACRGRGKVLCCGKRGEGKLRVVNKTGGTALEVPCSISEKNNYMRREKGLFQKQGEKTREKNNAGSGRKEPSREEKEQRGAMEFRTKPGIASKQKGSVVLDRGAKGKKVRYGKTTD